MSASAAVTLVVLAQALWLGSFARQSWFYADDWLNFVLARESGLTTSYLLQPIFVHVAPLHRLADSLLQSFAPLDWNVAATVLISLACAGTVVLDRLLATLAPDLSLGARIGLLLPYAFSVPLLGSVLWWSNGLVVLPGSVASLVCLLFFARARAVAHAPRPSARSATTRIYLILALIAYAVALVGYAKALALPFVVAGLIVLAPPGDLRLRDILSRLREHAGFLAAQLALSAAFVGLWLGSPAHYPLPRASLDQVLAFAGVVWSEALVPGILGIDPARLPARSRTIVNVGCQVLAAASAVAAWRRGARPLRGVALLLLGLAPGLALIAWGQVGTFGPSMGRALRYVAESSWLVPLGILVAVPRTDVATAGPAATPLLRSIPLLGATIATYLTIATAFGAALALTSPARDGQEWFANVLEGVRARTVAAPSRTRATPLRLRDGAVPDFVLAAMFAPFNQLSRVLPLHPDLRHLEFAADAPLAVGPRGYVVEVR